MMTANQREQWHWMVSPSFCRLLQTFEKPAKVSFNGNMAASENTVNGGSPSKRPKTDEINKVSVVLGAQWGDEGKGKIVDLLATEANIVCRCQVGAK